MKEADFQSLFTKWIRIRKYSTTAAWELKICKAGSLPFTRVEQHQANSLKRAKDECQYHKISDQAMGFHPFDAMQICFSEAWVVILFYTPRKKKEMVWVDIDIFLDESKSSKRRSLTEQRAKEIGVTYTL